MFVAAAYRAVWDRLPIPTPPRRRGGGPGVRRRGKSGLSAGVLTMTPSPWMIRRTGRNRFGHELARTPVANPQRRRLPRLRLDLPSSLLTPRTGRRPQARPVSRRTVCEVTTVWLGRSDWSRRDTRQRAKRLGSGPIGGGGDSPVTHRAPGYRHDCAQSRGSNQPPPSSSVRARTSRFSAATNRSEVPAHTVVASPRCAGEPTLRTC